MRDDSMRDERMRDDSNASTDMRLPDRAVASGGSTGAGPGTDLFSHPVVVAIDSGADRFAASMRGRAGTDRVLYTLSQAANHSLLWHGINVVDGIVGGPVHRRRALRRSIILGADQALVNGPVKWLFRRRRPDEPGHHPHELRKPVTSSFPSGHASAAVCAATLLSRDLGAPPVWWGLAAAVAWSRVHVGVHHATDVMGGVAAGVVLTRLAARAWPPPVGGGSRRSPAGTDRAPIATTADTV